MKVGDLVIGANGTNNTKPGVLVEVVESDVFGGDVIVSVLWAGQTRALKTMMSSLKRVNP